jgi:hypothetical protein
MAHWEPWDAWQRRNPPHQGGGVRSRGTHSSVRALLDREARPRVAGHVTALELSSAERRGPKLQDAWQCRSPSQQGGWVWSCRTRDTAWIHAMFLVLTQSMYMGVPGMYGTDRYASPPSEVQPPARSELNFRGLHAKCTIMDQRSCSSTMSACRNQGPSHGDTHRAFTTSIEREREQHRLMFPYEERLPGRATLSICNGVCWLLCRLLLVCLWLPPRFQILVWGPKPVPTGFTKNRKNR